MKFNNLKISQRLGLGFGAVLLLLLLLTAMAFNAVTSATAGQQRLLEMNRLVQLADEWVASTQLNVNRVMAMAKSANHPEVDSYFKPLMAETTERINTLQKDLEAAITSEQGKSLLADIGARRKEYIEVRKTYFDALKAVEPEASTMLTEKLLPAAQRYIGAMQELQKHEHALVAQEVEQASAALSRQMSIIGVLACAALVVGVLVAWRAARSVSVPVAGAVRAARAVADGDLTQPLVVDRGDELGQLQQALADMKASLVATVSQVRGASDSINVASREIVSGNHDLSSRTEQAASNLQQTAASMEELTSTVRNSADAARQANQLAANASEIAVRGGQVVDQVVHTMQEIHHSSQKISDIIGVIDGIAFQTNILALNAAVEAARAGEQGRGFAVVAAEVRSLAQRSAEAAKEIKGLISASVDRVDAGSRLVGEAGQTMNEVVGSIRRVTDIVGEISAAAGEQSDGIGQVNTAVNQLDQMTQQNAALVEESAAAAESLKDQAARLAQVVSIFKVDGATRATEAAAKPAAGPAAPVTRATTAPVQAARAPASAPAKAAASPVVREQPPKASAAAPLTTATRAPAPAVAPVSPAKVVTSASANTEGDWESF
ncbi:methyl-accepting chemotaxis protein [Hydrogenophaga pseudoflava]|uniref:Methyl-accepting chemotaxis protein II n=1 Tax=Hydrogenophaga pseudoflava TaxID=47421 RepID=A0A4P6X392_HYDPS|nr:methyl-accepting chemotaxis protein [Hydrogenophaga pseudoflava]QBM30590.1 Methyl-accepting chemotaxis protein II [Hydrogenophaga pseudoflava]